MINQCSVAVISFSPDKTEKPLFYLGILKVSLSMIFVLILFETFFVSQLNGIYCLCLFLAEWWKWLQTHGSRCRGHWTHYLVSVHHAIATTTRAPTKMCLLRLTISTWNCYLNLLTLSCMVGHVSINSIHFSTCIWKKSSIRQRHHFRPAFGKKSIINWGTISSLPRGCLWKSI